MKYINYKFFVLLIFSVLLVSCSDDDKSSTEPGDAQIDAALVGSWELTKILAPLVATPAEINLALSADFNPDGTMQLTTIDDSGTIVDDGTWSTADGIITITLEGENPGSSAYSVSDNTATISGFPVTFQGTTVLATLEFTKK